MELTRKQKRKLKKLRQQANSLLQEQRLLLSHAGELAQQAGREARQLSDVYISPRVGEAIDTVRPALDRGVHAARNIGTRARLFTAPILAAALASTVRGLDRLESHEAAKHVQDFGVRQGLLQPAKKRFGFGRAFAIGAGIAATAAVAYTLWQAFRSDDELWMASEEPWTAPAEPQRQTEAAEA